MQTMKNKFWKTLKSRSIALALAMMAMAFALIHPVSAEASSMMSGGNSIMSAEASVTDLNMDANGSITITLKDGKRVVSSGELTLIPVAKLILDEGNMTYQYINGWEGTEVDLTDPSRANLAEELEKVIPQDAETITKEIDEEGTVKFKDLALGLYLVRQTKKSTYFEPIQSFVVTIPLESNGQWVYDVDASPKVEVTQEETTGPHKPSEEETTSPPTKPTTEPPTSSQPVETMKPGDSRLPQTGQLDWPIPVLAGAGVLLFTVGLILWLDKSRKCR